MGEGVLVLAPFTGSSDGFVPFPTHILLDVCRKYFKRKELKEFRACKQSFYLILQMEALKLDLLYHKGLFWTHPLPPHNPLQAGSCHTKTTDKLPLNSVIVVGSQWCHDVRF